MYYPTKKEFIKLAKKGNVIPVYREISADFDTPLSAFLKIDDKKHSFLFESVEGGEKIGRYSFLSSSPRAVIESKGRRVSIKEKNNNIILNNANPLDEIAKFMKQFRFVEVAGLPRFCGGLIGYIGYDAVRFIEKIPDTCKDDLALPDIRLMLTDTLLVFDHVSHTMKVVSNAFIKKHSKSIVARAYKDAIKDIDCLIEKIGKPLKNSLGPIEKTSVPINIKANISRASFKKDVLRAKGYIKAGDAIQVVLSQRFHTDFKGNPINIYRALRSINPSPYMFYVSFKDFKLIGSSPEIMVRGENGIAQVRPIAGTRPRGKDEKEDIILERSLLCDKKERAEHLMLVDLGRNDLGRVCRAGSIKVNDFMVIERYSHVMHIVSDCTGKLLPSADAMGLLKASFPAGTVTGAPKIRAMEIIDELEQSKRGPYAGCVGYISFSGNLDTCITIRTVLLKAGKAYVQAGAGIVADSVPEKEFQETVNKAKGMFRAIAIAESVK
jgi:anthranilate synthase component I